MRNWSAPRRASSSARQWGQQFSSADMTLLVGVPLTTYRNGGDDDAATRRKTVVCRRLSGHRPALATGVCANFGNAQGSDLIGTKGGFYAQSARLSTDQTGAICLMVLTIQWLSYVIAGLLLFFFGRHQHETYFPAFRYPSQAQPRLSRSHEDPRWPRCAERTPLQGPLDPVRLIMADASGMSGATGFRFTRMQRILKTDEFSSVFLVCATPSPICISRFWFVQTPGFLHVWGWWSVKKTDKRAVARNYMKRTIRETFRLHAHTLHGLDLVVRTRQGFNRREGAAARAELLELFLRVSAVDVPPDHRSAPALPLHAQPAAGCAMSLCAQLLAICH